jgi:hypothetical protein
VLAVYNTVRPYSSSGYLTPVELAGRTPRSDSCFAIIDSTFRENSAQKPPDSNYSMLLIPNVRISRVSVAQNQLFLSKADYTNQVANRCPSATVSQPLTENQSALLKTCSRPTAPSN